MNKIKTFFFLILLGTTLPAFSKITVDGVLNEEEWQTAQAIDEFFVVSPFSLPLFLIQYSVNSNF
jgi:hypothetical protein